MYALDVGGAEIGEVVPRFDTELNEILGINDSRISGKRFTLHAGGLRSASLDTDVMDQSEAPRMLEPLIEPSLRSQDSMGMWTVVLLDEYALEDVVRSKISQLRASVADEQMSVEPTMAVAQEVLAPGAGVAGHVVSAMAAPVTEIASNALGMGEGAQVRAVARELAMDGVTPSNFAASNDLVLQSIASKASGLVPAEAITPEAPTMHEGDSVVGSASLADGSAASDYLLAMDRRAKEEAREAAEPHAASEAYGAMYRGPILHKSGGLLYQHTASGVVTHRQELFDDQVDRAVVLELELGEPYEISYDDDGPSIRLSPEREHGLSLER
jgi:hypothetical protein